MLYFISAWPPHHSYCNSFVIVMMQPYSFNGSFSVVVKLVNIRGVTDSKKILTFQFCIEALDVAAPCMSKSCESESELV